MQLMGKSRLILRLGKNDHASRESLCSIRQGRSFVLISVYYSSATEMQFAAVIVRLHLFTLVPQAVSVIQSLAPTFPGNHATVRTSAVCDGRRTTLTVDLCIFCNGIIVIRCQNNLFRGMLSLLPRVNEFIAA